MFLTRTVEINTAKRIDLVMRRNDSPWRARFRLTTADGTPLDMTGYGARMQLRLFEGMPGVPNLGISVPVYSYFLGSDGTRRTFKGGERWVSRDSPGGSEITMNADGFEVAIVAADILFIPPSFSIEVPMMLKYDIVIKTPAGDENAWFEGDLELRDGVSRPMTDADRDVTNQAYFEMQTAASINEDPA